MKLTKKVLSVVLALVLALSAFAVVGSANGNPDTANYNVKIWLTGAVGEVNWETKTRVSITEGDESARRHGNIGGRCAPCGQSH